MRCYMVELAVRSFARSCAFALLRRVSCVALLFFLPLVIGGCVPSGGIHVYEGSERSLKDVAVVVVDNDVVWTEEMNRLPVCIRTIDGQKVRSGGIEYHLVPGEHTVGFKYCIVFPKHPAYARQQIERNEGTRIKKDTERRAKTGDILRTVKIYTDKPVTLRNDFRKGYVYKIFARPVPCDPKEWVSPPLPAIGGGAFDGPFDITPPPKIYIHRGLVLLGTVEEVACSPGLLPDYEGLIGSTLASGAAAGGIIGSLVAYALSPTPKAARAWKKLAEGVHCPGKGR
jgi:hypothetical protein